MKKNNGLHKILKRKKQNGVVIIAISVVIGIAGLSLVSYLQFSNDTAFGDFQQTEESRSELMSNVRNEIQDFYIAHSNELNSEDLPSYIDEEYIKRQIMTPANSTIKLNIGITSMYEDSRVTWRDIYVWIPSTDGMDNSVFSPDGDQSNAFVPSDGVAWVSYSGRALESQKYAEASAQIEDIAQSLRAMFSSKVEADPLRDISANYFANCGPRPRYARGEDTLDCSGASNMETLASLGANNSLGYNLTDFKNPWGGDIYASNQDGALILNNEAYEINSSQYPYTMILTTKTPAGYDIFKYVAQPL